MSELLPLLNPVTRKPTALKNRTTPAGVATSWRQCRAGYRPKRWRRSARCSRVRLPVPRPPRDQTNPAPRFRVRRGPGHAVRRRLLKPPQVHSVGVSLHRSLTFSHPHAQNLTIISLRESLGISADGSEKAFGTEAIADMVKRIPNRISYNVREPTSNVNHVFVACDPSGGGASAFSIASLIQEASGFLQARAPNPARCHFPCPPSTCS